MRATEFNQFSWVISMVRHYWPRVVARVRGRARRVAVRDVAARECARARARRERRDARAAEALRGGGGTHTVFFTGCPL